MAVGYGYVRDDKPTQVDWGQITKDARESIKSIESDRQSRRDKIEQDQRDFTKMLAERPLGGDPVYQRFMGKYSAMTSAAMLENLNRLKRGEIGEQEFNTFRATVASGAEGMVATGKAYIAGYDEMAELAAGDGAMLTKYMNANAQRLFSLEGVEPMVDPITGETTYFIENEDGEKEIVDVSLGLRRTVAKTKAFDTENFMTDILKAKPNTFVDDLKGSVTGQFLKQVNGKVTFDESPIRTQAQAAVQQNSHVFDILGLNKTQNAKGETYRVQALPSDYYTLQTQEERDSRLAELQLDTSILYVDNNDGPLVSEAQRDEAENFIVNEIKSRATRSDTAAGYLEKQKIDADLKQAKETIKATVAKTLNTNANTNLIKARTLEVDDGEDSDIAQNMESITEFIRNEISGPIAAGLSRGKGMRLPFTTGWLTDRDNQIAKRLNSVLGNIGVSIDSQKLGRQQLELRIPTAAGSFANVEIDIRGLNAEEIIDKVTEAVVYVPDENLQIIYDRFIKDKNVGGSTPTTTTTPVAGGGGELD
ncbi:MAG: hypothetical protein CMP84_13850 [Gammaproteobacteria bacterium]|nr:hypothetical protein [Gammaproteobacteria bacterium]|tara:strand:- start:5548 stop:7152 length:1605 start_codon:yes stop_codon:yes gene_type:complete